MGPSHLRCRVRGRVALLTLLALPSEPMHGYAPIDWVEHRTNGEVDMADSALREAVGRIEQSGRVASGRGPTRARPLPLPNVASGNRVNGHVTSVGDRVARRDEGPP